MKCVNYCDKSLHSQKRSHFGMLQSIIQIIVSKLYLAEIELSRE